MNADQTIFEKVVAHAISGQGAHVGAGCAFEGLDWQVAGAKPHGAPYSIFQLLNHIVYWQDWVVEWLEGTDPEIPKHASGSWPGSESPEGPDAWDQAKQRFEDGLDELNRRSREVDLLSKGGNKSALEILQTIASHNSYHIGQVVLLRQMLGAWPPPSGGVTW